MPRILTALATAAALALPGLATAQEVDPNVHARQSLMDLYAYNLGVLGGMAQGRIASTAAYQVPFAQTVKQGAGIPTMAVGLLGDIEAAEAILQRGEADFIALARGALDDPNWAAHAARVLDQDYDLWPVQTQRVSGRDQVLGLRA